MSAIIKEFPVGLEDGLTRLEVDPELILEQAKNKLSSVVLIGFHGDGSFYFASSDGRGPEVLWLLEMAKKKLLELGEG